MTTVVKQPAAAAKRPLTVRMRPDLVVVAQALGGRRYWAVKDPVAMAYFRLRDEELAVLEMLDGQTSVTEIVARFERRFAPRRLTPERLQAFLARLHRDGLIPVRRQRAGGPIARPRQSDRRRRRRWMSLASLLAIRLPGSESHADIWTEYTHLCASSRGLPWCCACRWSWRRFSFSRRTMRASRRLPDWQGYFTPRSAVLVVVAVSLVKVLHELGHALVCRHYGGECHEVGPMFLVFAPCLYCDVSDSWMFDGKWRRIAVAAAGIYVEVVLAAAATFLWWWSEPGFVNALCMNIMFVGSINTLLFNGNPLLRYDGYYVLSDIVEIPNLAEQSATALRALWLALPWGCDPRRIQI